MAALLIMPFWAPRNSKSFLSFLMFDISYSPAGGFIRVQGAEMDISGPESTNPVQNLFQSTSWVSRVKTLVRIWSWNFHLRQDVCEVCMSSRRFGWFSHSSKTWRPDELLEWMSGSDHRSDLKECLPGVSYVPPLDLTWLWRIPGLP